MVNLLELEQRIRDRRDEVERIIRQEARIRQLRSDDPANQAARHRTGRGRLLLMRPRNPNWERKRDMEKSA